MRYFYSLNGGRTKEELTVEKYKLYRNEDITFYNSNGKQLSRAQFVQLLLKDIDENDKKMRSELEEEGYIGRDEKGRFDKGNIKANKFIGSAEEIYLLYLLLGTRERAARALGIHRQTLSEKIRLYDEIP